MRTYIYIDGFNFYYGAVKDTPYKWLDFKNYSNPFLLLYADFTKRIRKGVLGASQLPDPIPGTTIHKPKVW